MSAPASFCQRAEVGTGESTDPHLHCPAPPLQQESGNLATCVWSLRVEARGRVLYPTVSLASDRHDPGFSQQRRQIVCFDTRLPSGGTSGLRGASARPPEPRRHSSLDWLALLDREPVPLRIDPIADHDAGSGGSDFAHQDAPEKQFVPERRSVLHTKDDLGCVGAEATLPVGMECQCACPVINSSQHSSSRC